MAEGFSTRSPWAKKQTGEPQSPPITSITEIMSEELVEQLQGRELDDFDEDQEALLASLQIEDGEMDEDDQFARDLALAMKLSEDPDCSEDARMALEMQRQFDREEEWQQQEGTGKTIHLSSDRHEYSKVKEEEDERWIEEEEEHENAIDKKYRSKVQEFPRCGFIRTNNGEFITKHDKEVGQQKNCQKMMLFPSNFCSGDIMDARLSSKIYNDLQRQARKEAKLNARIKDKETKQTQDQSVDQRTRLIILKWINNGDLDHVQGIVAIGKESTVLHAFTDHREDGPSNAEASEEKHFAIKVYKQNLNAFKNRAEYIKDDFRFKNPRGILKIWALKEMMNLTRLQRANLPCPQPIALKKHVLLMTLVGNDRPAPKLKNFEFESDEQKADVFAQVKSIMIRMHNDCRLVHGDLSEFNLLLSDGKVFVIDVAQAVDLSHPRALLYLARDVENVLEFFGNLMEGLPSKQELFGEITDIKLAAENDLVAQVEAFERENPTNMTTYRKRTADYELMMWNREEQQKQKEAADADDSDSDEEE